MAQNMGARQLDEIGFDWDPLSTAWEEGFAALNYFPPDMNRREFYRPSQFGFDKEIAKRLDYWNRKRREQAGQ